MISRQATEFERALQRATEGGQVGPQMLPLVQVARLAAALADPPPPAPYRLAPGRQRFLAEAARHRTATSQKRKQQLPVAWIPRLGTALLAAILLFGLVFGVGRVAADSLPGQPLYGLKLATQNARLLLTVDPQARADLSLALAEDQLHEIAALLERGETVQDSSRIERQLRIALQAASEVEGPETVQGLRRLEVAIENWERTITGLMGGLAEPGQTLQQMVQGMEQVRLEAHVGQEDPDGLRQRLRHGTPSGPTEQPATSQTPEPSPTPQRRGAQPAAGPGPGAGPHLSATHEPATTTPAAQPSPGPSPHATRAYPGAGTDAPHGPRPTRQREGSPTPRPQQPVGPDTPQPSAGPKHTPKPTDQPRRAGPGATSTPGGPQPTQQPGVGPGRGPGATDAPQEPNPTSEPGKGPGPQPTEEPGGPPAGEGPGGGPGPDSPPPSGAGNGGGGGGKP